LFTKNSDFYGSLKGETFSLGSRIESLAIPPLTYWYPEMPEKDIVNGFLALHDRTSSDKSIAISPALGKIIPTPCNARAKTPSIQIKFQ